MDWADGAIRSLNHLYGGAQASRDSPPGLASPLLNSSQRFARQRVLDCFRQVGAQPADLSSKEALRELLAGSAIYPDSSTRKPYARHLVAWLEVGSEAAPVASCLSSADLEWLRSWRDNLVLPANVAELQRRSLGLSGPYVDPAL
eukprot:5097932-Pyramimonas_sp.AAC.1